MTVGVVDIVVLIIFFTSASSPDWSHNWLWSVGSQFCFRLVLVLLSHFAISLSVKGSKSSYIVAFLVCFLFWYLLESILETKVHLFRFHYFITSNIFTLSSAKNEDGCIEWFMWPGTGQPDISLFPEVDSSWKVRYLLILFLLVFSN